jgi:hypothetical protein
MREGYWINVRTGLWFEVDDHALALRRVAWAQKVGLPEAVVQRIQRMPLRDLNGPDRRAILLVAMAEGLVRVRGHHTHVTAEATWPLLEVLPALATFLARVCGPYTMLKIHRLPWGPFYALPYRHLVAAMERDDLATLFPPVADPLASLDYILPTASPEEGKAGVEAMEADPATPCCRNAPRIEADEDPQGSIKHQQEAAAVEDPLAFLAGVNVISPQAALDKADRLFEIIQAGLARGEKALP